MNAANPPLLAFALVGHSNDRDEFWYELVTVRKSADGAMLTRHNVCSMALGRRLADRLCDRYGIADRAGLYTGWPFAVNQTEQAAMVRGYTRNERVAESGEVYRTGNVEFPQAVSQQHADTLHAINFG